MKNEKFQTCIVFVLLASVIALTRYHYIEEPLERDIAVYAVYANEMHNGKYLYSDLPIHHPPGSFITNYLFQSLFGYGPFTIFLIGTTFSLLAMVGVYAALCNIDRSAALWAAAFWAVISCNAMIQANQPNAELFMNACLTIAFAFLMRDSGKDLGIKVAIGAGTLIALSSFYKPITVIAAVFFSIGHFISVSGKPQKIRALKQVAIMALIGFFFWGIVWGYLKLIGIFDDYWKFFFDYSQFYSGNFFLNFLQGFSTGFLIPEKIYALIPIIILCIIGMVFTYRVKLKRNGILITFYALAAPLMILLPGRFYLHYYQLWLPVLSIGGGYALYFIRSQIKDNAERTTNILGCVFVGLLIFFQLPDLKISLDKLPIKKYGEVGMLFRSAKNLAPLINGILKKDEFFFNIGSEAGLYFYSKRRPLSGQIWFDYYLQGPLSDLLTKRLLTDLKKNPPILVLVTYHLFPKNPIWKWLFDGYKPVSNQKPFAPFTAYSLNGVDINSRLKSWSGFQKK